MSNALIMSVGQVEDANKTITQLTVQVTALRASSPAQQVVWYLPPPPLPAPVSESSISPAALRMMLNSRDVDLADAAFVATKKALLPPQERVRVEQILQTHLFRQWIVSTGSSKLLATWDGPQTVAGVSALSGFCATLADTLRAAAASPAVGANPATRQRFVSALWFCGRHADRRAGRAMAAGLVDQLLRQHTFDTHSLFRDLPPARLEAADAEALGLLLDWLIRRLPRTVTLVCIVDGVALCERQELREEALPVLAGLLALTGDPTVEATVKVLFTSTPSPVIVKAPFKMDGGRENLIVDVKQLPPMPWAVSDERMARELERGLGTALVERQG